VGLARFVSDLVEFGIGDEWRPAIELLQISGVVAALAQICFNWDAYFRALGNTRPIAVHGWAAATTFLVVGIPLLLAYDLRGLALGIAAQAAAALAVRLFYVKRLFGDLHLIRHALAGILPVIPGTVLVLLLRVLESGPRTLAEALTELFLFVAVTALATWRADGPLLREFRGYLRRDSGAPAGEAPASA
jgi:O-antigen/teichoic acid export membrane protein